MDQDTFAFVATGSTMIVIISVFLLPISIWNSETGRYKGFFNLKAVGVMLFTAVYFAVHSYKQGNPPDIVMADIFGYLFLAVSGARIMVEFTHHYKYKVWLHRQYHKLTDHDDPRGASP